MIITVHRAEVFTIQQGLCLDITSIPAHPYTFNIFRRDIVYSGEESVLSAFEIAISATAGIMEPILPPFEVRGFNFDIRQSSY